MNSSTGSGGTLDAGVPQGSQPARSMAANLLSIRNLSKHYGDFRAVDNVSLDVRRGELMTFLGPSGSGKTTTLNMVAGFDTPTAGEILIDNQDISRVIPSRRNIGMVFQRYTLFPHMTVAENVGFPLMVRRVAKPQIAERVTRVLKLIRLESFGDRRPSQLSGGQQQRVALARALIYEPRLLLMDEPLGALDKRLREEIQLEIRRIHHQLDVTIIYVTHDQEEALRLSDRIAVFDNGRIAQIGAARELYDQPANAFVGAFLGNSNFLTGKIATANGGRYQVTLKDGSSIEAPARLALAPEQPVSVMFRPEKAILQSVSETSGFTNRVVGRITENVFLGDSATYEVRTASGELVTVKQPFGPSETKTRTMDEEIAVSWPHDCVHIFPIDR
ncbi:MAG: ABC transporter ATP-binding protein [Dongiaceae bacterium]